jgi:hypothetical protein
MDCHQGLSLAKLATPIIAACAGLGGVLLGGAITIWSQAKERRQARVRDKLDKFYSPLLALRMQIKAKSEVRQKVHGAAQVEWRALFKGVSAPQEKARIETERGPEFEKIFNYSEEQLKNELVPLYRQMVDLFSANMQFAEEETRKYFGILVEFVELWNRQLLKPMPPEVVLALNQKEENLYPFYEDLETQFRKLREELE